MFDPGVPDLESAVALNFMAFFLVGHLFAEFFFEGWKEIEGDVGGDKFLQIAMGDVVGEGAVRAEPWRGDGRDSMSEGCGVAAG